MEPGADHIVVWVGQEEKNICGLTRHTTSADVVQALLEDQKTVMGNSHMHLGNPKEYYITQQWREFQCTLPPTAKMLKIWKAWGTEQVNVQFILVKSELRPPCSVWNTPEYYKHSNYIHHSTASVIKSFPLQKQKCIVRKAFRKLAKMKKGTDLQEKNNMKKLVQIIASQELTIKTQINRMLELDEQIEEYKTYLHLDKEAADELSDHSNHLKEDEFQQQRCKDLLETDIFGELFYIKDETNGPSMHTETLSIDIKDQAPPMYECEGLCAGGEDFNESWEMCMMPHLRLAVDESIQVGEKIHSLFSCLHNEIRYEDSVLLRQRREFELLKQELKLLNEPNNVLPSASTNSCNISTSTEIYDKLNHVTMALSAINIQSDTDSDTGISSTHSQNSDLVS